MPQSESTILHDPVQVPLYSVWDAAKYLHLPMWSLEGLRRIFPHHTHEDFFGNTFWPVLREIDGYSFGDRNGHESRLSFQTVCSVFLHSFTFRLPFQRNGEWHPELELMRVQGALEKYASGEIALSDPDFLVEEIEQVSPGFTVADRVVAGKLAAVYLSRIEFENGAASRLFPFSRDPLSGSPRDVVIDPAIRFGRPSVGGAPTDVLVERWRAGDSVADLAEDYGLSTAQVDEAIRYETMPYSPRDPMIPHIW